MDDTEATESQYNRPPSYALSEQQRDYLINGETGAYRESKLEADVQEKVEQLGHRLDHLLSDVELLAQNGYFDEGDWQDVWLALVGFDEWEHTPSTFRTIDGGADTDRGPTVDEIATAFTVGKNPSRGRRPTSAPAELARDVGQMIYRLTIVPDEAPEEDAVLREMAWGMVQGFYSDLRSSPMRYEKPEAEPMSELLEYFDNRRDIEVEYNKDSRKMWQSMQEHSDAWDSIDQEIRDRIRDILAAEGLPVETFDFEAMETPKDTISVHDAHYLLIDHLVTDVDTDPDSPIQGDKPFTSGQHTLFTRAYGPADEFDVEEVVTREDVLTIVTRYNMVTKAKLDPLVVEESERVEEMSWKTISAVDVLGFVSHVEGRPTSRQIAEGLETASHQDSVTKLCRDLAGRETEAPIIDGDTRGWELTEWGELIKKSVGASYAIPNSIWSDDPEGRAEKIARVGAEFGIEGWDWDE